MKKIILVSIIFTVLVSCTKYSEQINVVKLDLESNSNLSKEEFESAKFHAVEMIGKDARREIVDTYFKRKQGAFGSALDLFNEKTLPTNQPTYRVEAYRIANDTTFKKIYYVNDKNEIISKFWLK